MLESRVPSGQSMTVERTSRSHCPRVVIVRGRSSARGRPVLFCTTARYRPSTSGIVRERGYLQILDYCELLRVAKGATDSPRARCVVREPMAGIAVAGNSSIERRCAGAALLRDTKFYGVELLAAVHERGGARFAQKIEDGDTTHPAAVRQQSPMGDRSTCRAEQIVFTGATSTVVSA